MTSDADSYHKAVQCYPKFCDADKLTLKKRRLIVTLRKFNADGMTPVKIVRAPAGGRFGQAKYGCYNF